MLKYSSFHGSMWFKGLFGWTIGSSSGQQQRRAKEVPSQWITFNTATICASNAQKAGAAKGMKAFPPCFAQKSPASVIRGWSFFLQTGSSIFTHHDFPLSRCSVTWKIVAANSRDLIWRYRKAGLFTNGSWTGRACRATGFWYKMFRCLLFKTNTKRVTDKTQQSMYFWLNMVCFSLL